MRLEVNDANSFQDDLTAMSTLLTSIDDVDDGGKTLPFLPMMKLEIEKGFEVGLQDALKLAKTKEVLKSFIGIM